MSVPDASAPNAFRRDLGTRYKMKEDTAARIRGLDSDWEALLEGWLMLLEEGERPALLRQLQRLGISSLGERQAVANALGRARREGCLQPPPLPPERTLDEVTSRALELLVGSCAASSSGEDGASAVVDTVARLGLDEGNSRWEAGGEGLLRQLHDGGKLVGALEALGMPPWELRMLVDSFETRGLRIGFYSNQLCERGTETALYDYAHYAETLLGATWVDSRVI